MKENLILTTLFILGIVFFIVATKILSEIGFDIILALLISFVVSFKSVFSIISLIDKIWR